MMVRNPVHAELKGGVGRPAQRFLDVLVVGGAGESSRMNAGLLTSLEDVRRDAQIAAVLECVAKLLEPEFPPIADDEPHRPDPDR
jgi:hypothetical protein